MKTKYIKKIKIGTVETFLGISLKSNYISLGIDVSVHSTGIALLRTTDTYLIVEEVKILTVPKNVQQIDAIDLFTAQLDKFTNHISQKCKLNITIIEDCFFGQNVKVLKALTRHAVLCYDRFKPISNEIKFILPTQARKAVNFIKSGKGIKGPRLKKEIIGYINNALDIKLNNKEHDIADGIVLSLCGLKAY